MKNYYKKAGKKDFTAELIRLEAYTPSDTIDQATELINLRNQMGAALGSLSPIQRQLIVLRYFEDCTTAQMALSTGLTPANVRTILSRALDKLERYWKFHGLEI